ncbi:MAG: tetratricopeptide repeat protein [Bacteroidota bacterium]
MNQRHLATFIFLFFGFLLWSDFVYSQSAVDSILEEGDDLISMEDYKAAEEKYDEALDRYEEYIPALKAKIRVLLLRDKNNRARRMAEESLEKHSEGSAAFHAYIGEALMGSEDYKDAVDHLDDALEMADKSDNQLIYRIFVNRGAVLQKLDNYEEALTNYSKALDIDQSNPNVFVYRGNLYYKRENYKKALADFKKVLELDPNNHVAQYNLGMCYFRQDDKMDACDAFHKACELGNKNACQMVVSKCLRNNETQ